MLTDGQPGFELRSGPLLDMAQQARYKLDARHFLVIDEINRGNLAKVLGELYFLLEYRNEEMRLQYSDEPFSLPDNLYVIGTMNTADRSIALVDLALRRRFHFVEFHPDDPPMKCSPASAGWRVACGRCARNRGRADRTSVQGFHVTNAERDEVREPIEVTVVMQKHKVVPHGADRDQAVDARAHGDPGPSCQPIAIDRLLEDLRPQRRLDDRQRVQRFVGDPEIALVPKPLQHFLKDRKADDDFLQVRDGLDGG